MRFVKPKFDGSIAKKAGSRGIGSIRCVVATAWCAGFGAWVFRFEAGGDGEFLGWPKLGCNGEIRRGARSRSSMAAPGSRTNTMSVGVAQCNRDLEYTG